MGIQPVKHQEMLKLEYPVPLGYLVVFWKSTPSQMRMKMETLEEEFVVMFCRKTPKL